MTGPAPQAPIALRALWFRLPRRIAKAEHFPGLATLRGLHFTKQSPGAELLCRLQKQALMKGRKMAGLGPAGRGCLGHYHPCGPPLFLQ